MAEPAVHSHAFSPLKHLKTTVYVLSNDSCMNNGQQLDNSILNRFHENYNFGADYGVCNKVLIQTFCFMCNTLAPRNIQCDLLQSTAKNVAQKEPTKDVQ